MVSSGSETGFFSSLLEDHKRLAERFGEATIRAYESAQKGSMRFIIKCMEGKVADYGKVCEAEADRRFPNPLKGQNLQ